MSDRHRKTAARTRSRLVRVLLIASGFVFTGLGILGIFLPLLPTTVFFLLAAGVWMKSSPRFYAWLTGNRWFGPYIRNYREKRGITVRHRVYTLTLLWVGIGSTILFAVDLLWLRLLLVAIAVAVTIHLFALRTVTQDESSD